MRKFIVFLLVLTISLVVSCANNVIKISKLNNEHFVVWALSDIQPRNKKERKHFKHALAKIKEIKKVDMAVVAGDIVHSKSEAVVDYKWYQKSKKSVNIKHWFEIAGNHENRDISIYKKHIRKSLHYAVTAGNLMFIFISDTNRKPFSEIPDKVFLWWKKLVINNQDKIIVTVSHAALNKSSLLASIIPSLSIKKSKRFEQVLRKYNVDLWISGHSHFAYNMKGDVTKPGRFKNTLFVDVSSIRKEILMLGDSYLIVFKQNSNRMSLIPIDHTKNKIQYGFGITHKLSYKFNSSGDVFTTQLFK